MIIKNKLCFLIFIMMLSSSAISQTCVDQILATTPTSHFTVHNNGTATHNKTGLMWQVCSQGQSWSSGNCTGRTTTHKWNLALQTPAILNISGGYAGHTDWRLPNIKELRSIAEGKCSSPAINTTIFPATPSLIYWSSSPHAKSFNLAWSVNFSHGYDLRYPRTNHYHLRLVRGGQ